MNVKIAAPIAIFALLAVGVIFFYSSQNTQNQDVFTGQPVTQSDGQSNNQAGESQVQIAELNPEPGYEQSTGIALRDFDGTTFTHSLTASLPEPPAGKFYEGWLVMKQPTLSFFSTGRLDKTGEGSYSLEYTSEENKNEYPDVVVTLETEENGLDGVPEAHVLEGTFVTP